MSDDGYFPLVEQVRAVLPDPFGGPGWTLRTDDDWCFVTPPGYRPRHQGWKLHVSATPLASLLVLARVARILVGRERAFKFAPTAERLVDLGAPKADRAGAGKFITVYPDDDAEVADLAARLHAALDGLPGPHILSDRRFAPGSLVHMRFGVFSGRPELTDNGELASRLRAPDGTPETDRRDAWFSVPAWATDPMPTPPSARPADPRLAGRYRVRTAVQHANKGGVFLADDERTGQPVVLKQARAHVGSTLSGRDVQDFLRTEAEMLDRLAPHDLSPARIDLFEVDDSLFLVQPELAGTTLGDWVLGRLEPGRPLDDALPAADVLPMARAAARLMAGAHRLGIRIGDFTPANIMVDPAGPLRLIDLESAATAGRPGAPMGTPGYLAPEAPEARGAGEHADRYALGAVLFFLGTGVDPVLMAEPGRPVGARLDGWLDLMGRSGDSVRRLAPVVLGLMADVPGERWDLDRVDAALARAGDEPEAPRAAARPAGPEPAELLADLTAALLDAAARPVGGPRTDPRAVQSGSAGMLAALLRLAPDADAIDAVAARLREPVPSGRVLPGLYSGAAGIAWAAFDAADRRGGDPAWALDLARELPTEAAMPDVFHGVAGAGLALLHLSRAGAGFLDAARDCGRTLAAAATPLGDGVCWPFPAGVDSPLAGQAHFGFGHGVAGIGAFLLALHAETGEPEHRDLAVRAGETLAANAQGDASGAWWYSDPAEQDRGEPPVAASFWCSGASGVGTFLVRLWAATGEPRWRGLAEAAGRTVLAERWTASTCYCHGLAGNGDFLLDLADALAPVDPGARDRYHAGAAELAALIAVRAARRDGRWLTPDDGHLAPFPGFLTGYAGTAAFLHRLLHGGSRLWLVDPTPTPRPPAAVAIPTKGETHAVRA